MANKEGNRKRYRIFGDFEYVDYMDWRQQLRGNIKDVMCRNMAHKTRANEKRKLREELNSI